MFQIIGALVTTLFAMSCLALPKEFSYLDDNRIIESMNYATHDNFIGRPISGYFSKACILTKEARNALISVQNELDSLNKGYALKVFDCYRPVTAVADFKEWSDNPKDQKMKNIYYPDFNKPDLFKLGYIADKSGHSRGSTVDLTIVIVDTKTKDQSRSKELDMGTIFDFFGEKSHTDSKLVSLSAQENRKILKNIMEKNGFKNFDQEWWHYTLAKEPFPDTYFDFPVK